MNWIDRLKKTLGENKVFDTLEQRETYARDESHIKETYLPDVVVHPESTEDVIKILKFAKGERIPVVPRGGGTGLTGGALAIYGGILIVFDRMAKIKDIDPDNLLAIVEPGVITGEFQMEVEKLNLFYPPDPASLENCTIGGNVAENAGGPRALKYGVTKHYVLSLEVVIPGGERLEMGKPTKKWVVGYDIPSLLVGSEGTLGVITEITLRLLPRPKGVMTLLIAFPNEVNSSDAVSEIIKSHILPSAIEFMDRKAIEVVRDGIPQNLPPHTGSLLLIEVDGWDESLLPQVETIGNICMDKGAIEIFAATEKKDRERIWEARRLVYPTLKEKFRGVRSEDIVIPRSRIVEAIRRLKVIEDKTGISLVTFGHAGDGNLHVNLLYEDEDERVEDALRSIYRLALSLGGTISGEHGVGISKKPYIGMEQTDFLIHLQKSIKGIWDPSNVMNPGKIFP
jgi:glycolate oxidase